jgi:hypothetical protein
MHQVIAERAADPEMQAVPGGKTGLLVRSTKGLGSGDNFTTVEEYEVDTALLKELREHELQAASEFATNKEAVPSMVNNFNGPTQINAGSNDSSLDARRAAVDRVIEFQRRQLQQRNDLPSTNGEKVPSPLEPPAGAADVGGGQ